MRIAGVLRRSMPALVVIVGLALTLLAAWRAVPREPWLRVEHAVGADPATVGPPITAAKPLTVRLLIPRAGLDRIDVRFHGTHPFSQGSVAIIVREGSSGRQLSTSDLDLRVVPNDGVSQLKIPHIARSDAHEVAVEFVPTNLARGQALSMYEFPCNCFLSGRLERARDTVPQRDLDMATYTYMPSRGDRLKVLAQRINATHPPAFGTSTLLTAAIVAFIAFGALLYVLTRDALLSVRRDAPSEGDAA